MDSVFSVINLLLFPHYLDKYLHDDKKETRQMKTQIKCFKKI